MSSTIGKRKASVKVESLTTNHKESNGRKRVNGSHAKLKSRDRSSRSTNGSAVSRDPARRTLLGFQVVAAQPGEHVVARQMMTGLMRGPSVAEFQAQLDDPFYEPTDRLLCKVNDYLVGHARIIKREMRFGPEVLPMALLADLIVLPEFRGHGCGTALLRAAEKEMVDDGALVAVVRTRQPAFFLQRGWSIWTRHCFSVAGVREILSCLIESRTVQNGELDARPSRYSIRLWRHIEQGSLLELYDANTNQAFGPFVRTDAYWSWLIGRHAYDRIYVAIDGPDRLDLEEASSIVGYAVMTQDRIVELMTSPEHKDAAPQLLARACSDAIEQDAHYVRLDAPLGDSLHDVVLRAGGEKVHHEAFQGEVTLVKILQPQRIIERLGEQFLVRARDAGIAIPVELGLHIGNAWYTLEIRPRMAKLKVGRNCRSHITCSAATLTQLLLGHLDGKTAIETQRVIASTRVAAELAGTLFPKLDLWRPPWDELPAL